MSDSIIIGDEKIPKGTNTLVEIKVAKLPSGTQIHIPVHVYRSKNKGPVILLSGGLHGDEVNGIEIVRRMVSGKLFDNILCGTVIALPIINIYGFINFSRDVPDGKDVNRSFPGYSEGSLASLVAYTLTNKILPAIDFGIDFHTGGSSRTNYPQTRYAIGDKLSAELADIFCAPLTMYSALIEGSLRAEAVKQGKSILVYEGGETLRFDEFAIEEGIKGTKRILKHYGMLKIAPKPLGETKLITKTTWIRAGMSGMFRAIRKSGEKVYKGQHIGLINSPSSDQEIKLEAPDDGYIISHNNLPVVHRGDALFNIGFQKE
jgi:predicted deacylase